MKKGLLSAAIALLGASLAAMGGGAVCSKASETITKKSTASAITINNINGSIEVAQSEDDAITIVATKTASAKNISCIVVDFSESDAMLTAKTVYSKTQCDGEVFYKIFAPKGTRLMRLTTVNGDVSVNYIEKNLHAKTTNGAIAIKTPQEFSGNIVASTTNGRITLCMDSIPQGTINATTTNGSIWWNDSKVQSNNVVGSSFVHNAETGDTAIHLTSVNGTIRITNKH